MAALDKLTSLLNRYEMLPEPAKARIWSNIHEAATEVEDEMIALEDEMSKKRDWLDTHRDDPRFQKRWNKFFDTEVRQHAAYGEALEAVNERLIGGGAEGQGPYGRRCEERRSTDASEKHSAGDDREDSPGGGVEDGDRSVRAVDREEPRGSSVLRQAGQPTLRQRLGERRTAGGHRPVGS